MSTIGDNIFFLYLEDLAIFCCGLTGGLCAVRKGYDLFAIVTTGWLTALGGGIVRDVLIGAIPPVGIADKRLVFTALFSSLLVAIIHPEVDKLKHFFMIIDALALGQFAIIGTQKALDYHTSSMTAVFMGMFTALAGGLIRDVLLNEVPMVVRDRHWYAVPTFIACIFTLGVNYARKNHYIGDNEEILCVIAIVLLVVLMRVLSVRYDLNLPGALHRHEAHLRMPHLNSRLVHNLHVIKKVNDKIQTKRRIHDDEIRQDNYINDEIGDTTAIILSEPYIDHTEYTYENNRSVDAHSMLMSDNDDNTAKNNPQENIE